MKRGNNYKFDKNNIINEAEIHPGGTTNILIFEDLSNKAKEGICKILLENNGYGTGFFVKIEDPEEEGKIMKVLFTCNHVLKKEFLYKYKKLTLELNNKEIIINLNKRRIWTNSEIDYTCIEIFKNDNIKYCFNIDENITIFNNKIENYVQKGIYIFGIMKDLNLGFDSGYITEVKNNMIMHNCNTNPGCSGGAIIEKIKNSIIGIHKGSYKNKINIGIFIKCIINDIENNNYFKINENDLNSNMNYYNPWNLSCDSCQSVESQYPCPCKNCSNHSGNFEIIKWIHPNCGGALDFMKMEKKNAKSVGLKISFVIHHVNVVMLN